MIRTDNLARVYPAPKGELRAVDGVSLQVAEGESLAIVGRSGSGKSTLLHLLGGLDHPTSGSIRVADSDVGSLGEQELARYRGEVVGTVFQFFHLVPTLSALQNVELPLMFQGVASSKRRQVATEAIAAVGLTNRSGHRPTQLSGGEQQRVAIARAIVAQPKLLLADEPTGNLDTETATTVVALLQSIVRERSLTLVIVTHDLVLAETIGDRVARMQDGRLVDESDWLASPPTPS